MTEVTRAGLIDAVADYVCACTIDTNYHEIGKCPIAIAVVDQVIAPMVISPLLARAQKLEANAAFEMARLTEARAERDRLLISLKVTQDAVDKKRPCTNCRHRASLHGRGYWGCWACDCGAFGEPPEALDANETGEQNGYPSAVSS